MIEIKNATKIYENKLEKKCAFHEVNLKFNDVGLVVIIGESGSGKTSLINCISQLDTLTEGSISGIKKTDSAFIFQDYQLIENLSVQDNLTLGHSYTEAQLKEILYSVNLEDIPLDKKIVNLSGGQKQRVSIARALLLNRKVIFADEPTGNLDKENSFLIAHLLKKISCNHLVIVVSHNEEVFSELADQVIHLNQGEITKIEGSTQEFKLQQEEAYIQKLSIKKAFMLCIKSVKRNMSKFIINCVLLFIIFISFIVTLAFVGNDSYYSTEKTFQEFNIEYVDFYEVDKAEPKNHIRIKDNLQVLTEEFKNENDLMLVWNCQSIEYGNVRFEDFKIYVYDYFKSTDSLNLSDNEIAISDVVAAKLMKEKKLSEEELLGKTIFLYNQPFSVAKIVSTTYDNTLKNGDKQENLRSFYYAYINYNSFSSIGQNYYQSSNSRYFNLLEDNSSMLGIPIERDRIGRLKGNEIILPESLVQSLYGPNADLSSGKTIQISFVQSSNGTNKYETIEFTIHSIGDQVVVSSEMFITLYPFWNKRLENNSYYGISLKNPHASDIKALEKANFYHFTFASEKLYSTEEYLTLIIVFMSCAFVLALLILVLFDLSLINASIHTKKKELGILKSMGFKSLDTYKLLIMDNIISMTISFVLSIILVPICIPLINRILIEREYAIANYIYFNYLFVFLLLAIMAILLGIYLLICHLWLSRKSDIDLVYEK